MWKTFNSQWSVLTSISNWIWYKRGNADILQMQYHNENAHFTWCEMKIRLKIVYSLHSSKSEWVLLYGPTTRHDFLGDGGHLFIVLQTVGLGCCLQVQPYSIGSLKKTTNIFVKRHTSVNILCWYQICHTDRLLLIGERTLGN